MKATKFFQNKRNLIISVAALVLVLSGFSAFLMFAKFRADSPTLSLQYNHIFDPTLVRGSTAVTLASSGSTPVTTYVYPDTCSESIDQGWTSTLGGYNLIQIKEVLKDSNDQSRARHPAGNHNLTLNCGISIPGNATNATATVFAKAVKLADGSTSSAQMKLAIGSGSSIKTISNTTLTSYSYQTNIQAGATNVSYGLEQYNSPAAIDLAQLYLKITYYTGAQYATTGTVKGSVMYPATAGQDLIWQGLTFSQSPLIPQGSSIQVALCDNANFCTGLTQDATNPRFYKYISAPGVPYLMAKQMVAKITLNGGAVTPTVYNGYILNVSSTCNQVVVNPTTWQNNVQEGTYTLMTYVSSNGPAMNSVKYYEGDTYLGDAVVNNNSYNLTRAFSAGDHSVSAKIDISGCGTISSTPATFNVAGSTNTPPTVTLTANPTTLTTAGTVTLTAVATDNASVSKIEYFEGSTTTPFATDANLSGITVTKTQSRNVTDTTIFKAKVTDNAGLTGENTVTVTKTTTTPMVITDFNAKASVATQDTTPPDPTLTISGTFGPRATDSEVKFFETVSSTAGSSVVADIVEWPTSGTITQIKVKIPSVLNSSRPYRLYVKNNNQSAVSPDGMFFRLLISTNSCLSKTPPMANPPIISTLSKNSGKPGDVITLLGKNFIGTDVPAALKTLEMVKIGGQAPIYVDTTSWTDTRIDAIVPNGLEPGEYEWRILDLDIKNNCFSSVKPFTVTEANNSCGKITGISPSPSITSGKLEFGPNISILVTGNGFGTTKGIVKLVSIQDPTKYADLTINSWNDSQISINTLIIGGTLKVFDGDDYRLEISIGSCTYKIGGFRFKCIVWDQSPKTPSDSSWGRPDNWKGGIVPGANDYVCIQGNTPTQNSWVTVNNANTEVKGIFISNNYTSTINVVSGIKITDEFRQGGGKVEAGNANFQVLNFIQLGGTFSAPGPVTGSRQCSNSTETKCLWLLPAGNNGSARLKVVGGTFLPNAGEVIVKADTTYNREVSLLAGQKFANFAFYKSDNVTIDTLVAMIGTVNVENWMISKNLSPNQVELKNINAIVRHLGFSGGAGKIKFGVGSGTVNISNDLVNNTNNAEIYGTTKMIDATQVSSIKGNIYHYGSFNIEAAGKTVQFEKQKIFYAKGAFVAKSSDASKPVKIKSSETLASGVCPEEIKIPLGVCANDNSSTCKMFANQWMLAAVGNTRTIQNAEISSSYFIGWKDENGDNIVQGQEDKMNTANSKAGDCWNRNWVNSDGVILSSDTNFEKTKALAGNWLTRLFGSAKAAF